MGFAKSTTSTLIVCRHCSRVYFTDLKPAFAQFRSNRLHMFFIEHLWWLLLNWSHKDTRLKLPISVPLYWFKTLYEKSSTVQTFNSLTANALHHIETSQLILQYKSTDWFLYDGEHWSLTGKEYILRL